MLPLALLRRYHKLLLLLLLFAGTVETEITPAPGGPPSSTPELAPSSTESVPVINIAPPNEESCSYNRFRKHDVGTSGVLYNNAPAGFDAPEVSSNPDLSANPRLGNDPAALILVEVLGDMPSHLSGPLTVYGATASFLLANPHGIYVDGAKFINTDRVTLSTGPPTFYPNSDLLKNFEVRTGSIHILKDGLLGPLLDLGTDCPIELLARTAHVSGALNASSAALSIYTGQNDFDYINHQLTPAASSPSGAPPKVSIDASLINSSITAGKVTLIATEDGVGMNLSAPIESSTTVSISSSGPVTLFADDTAPKKSLTAGSDMLIKAPRLVNHGALFAGNSLDLDVRSGTLQNHGQLSGANLVLYSEQFDNESLGTAPAHIESRKGLLHIKSKTVRNLGSTIQGHGGVVLDTDELENKDRLGGDKEEAVYPSNILSPEGDVHIESKNAHFVGGKIEAQNNLTIKNKDALTFSPRTLLKKTTTTTWGTQGNSGWFFGGTQNTTKTSTTERQEQLCPSLIAGNELRVDSTDIDCKGLNTSALATYIFGKKITLAPSVSQCRHHHNTEVSEYSHVLCHLIAEGRKSESNDSETQQSRSGNNHIAHRFFVNGASVTKTQAIEVYGGKDEEGKVIPSTEIKIEDAQGDVLDTPLHLKNDTSSDRKVASHNRLTWLTPWITFLPKEKESIAAPDPKYALGHFVSLHLAGMTKTLTKESFNGIEVVPSQLFGEKVSLYAPHGHLHFDSTQIVSDTLLKHSKSGITYASSQEKLDQLRTVDHKSFALQASLHNEYLALGYSMYDNLKGLYKDLVSAPQGTYKTDDNYYALFKKYSIEAVPKLLSIVKTIANTQASGNRLIANLGKCHTLGFSASLRTPTAWHKNKEKQSLKTSLSPRFVAKKHLSIYTSGTLAADGASLISEGSASLKAKSIVSKGLSHERKTETSQYLLDGEASLSLDEVSLSWDKNKFSQRADVSGGLQFTNKTEIGHSGLVLRAPKVALSIDEDVSGPIQVLGDVKGHIRGSVRLTHHQNSIGGTSHDHSLQGALLSSGEAIAHYAARHGRESGNGTGASFCDTAYDKTACDAPQETSSVYEQSFYSHIDGLGDTLAIGANHSDELPAKFSHTKSAIGGSIGCGFCPRTLRDFSKIGTTLEVSSANLNGKLSHSPSGVASRTIEEKCQVNIVVDRSMVEFMIDPVGHLRELGAQGATLLHMGKGVGKKLYNYATETESDSDAYIPRNSLLSQIYNGIQLASDLHMNHLDPTLGDLLRDPSSQDLDEHKALLGHEHRSLEDGTPGKVDIYNSKDPEQFPNHGEGEQNPAHHKGNYDEATDTARLNMAHIPVDDGGATRTGVSQAELIRRRLFKGGHTNILSDDQQRHQVQQQYKAGYAHHQSLTYWLGTGSKARRTNAVWQQSNRAGLQRGTQALAALKSSRLKPCMEMIEYQIYHKELQESKYKKEHPGFAALHEKLSEARSSGDQKLVATLQNEIETEYARISNEETREELIKAGYFIKGIAQESIITGGYILEGMRKAVVTDIIGGYIDLGIMAFHTAHAVVTDPLGSAYFVATLPIELGSMAFHTAHTVVADPLGSAYFAATLPMNVVRAIPHIPRACMDYVAQVNMPKGREWIELSARAGTHIGIFILTAGTSSGSATGSAVSRGAKGIGKQIGKELNKVAGKQIGKAGKEAGKQLGKAGKAAKGSAKAAKGSAKSAKGSAKSAKGSAKSAKGSAEVVKEPAKVAKEPAKVAKEPAKVAKEPAKVAKEPAKVVEKPAEVAKEPAKVVEKPVKESAKGSAKKQGQEAKKAQNIKDALIAEEDMRRYQEAHKFPVDTYPTIHNIPVPGEKARTFVIKDVDSLINAGEKPKLLRGGKKQLSVKGNIEQYHKVFEMITRGSILSRDNKTILAKFPDGSALSRYASSTTKDPTIHVHRPGCSYIIKIRFKE